MPTGSHGGSGSAWNAAFSKAIGDGDGRADAGGGRCRRRGQRFASLDDDKDGKLKPADFRRRRPVGVSAGGVTASAEIAPRPA